MNCPVCEQEMTVNINYHMFFACKSHLCPIKDMDMRVIEIKLLESCIKSSKTVEKYEEIVYELQKQLHEAKNIA